MMRTQKKLPTTIGEGQLVVARQSYAVAYQIGSADNLKSGKGSATGDPAVMRSAFSAGDATLQMENGQPLPVFFLAHTAGSDTAYFEVRRLG
jgi:hypothetical protein